MDESHKFSKSIQLNDKPEIINDLVNKQWQDIHHSRNQDWIYWTILSALIAGIFTLFGNENNISDRILFIFMINILITGVFIISLWASAISWSHWILHIRRLGYITWLEEFYYLEIGKNQIALKVPKFEGFNKKDIFVVNGLIFSMYSSISLLFFVLLIFSFTQSFNIIIISKDVREMLLNLSPFFLVIIWSLLLFIIHTITKKMMNDLKDGYLKQLRSGEIINK